MSSDVAIVNYGSGNVASVMRAMTKVGAAPALVSDPDAIAGAERVILPGVGAFAACRALLDGAGLIEPIRRFIATGRPLLGICVGMQMFFDASSEFGEHVGLGIIAGRVDRIPSDDARKIPHIGWSAMHSGPGGWDDTLFDGLPESVTAYFVHSFRCQPSDPNHVLSRCDYEGLDLCAAVQRDNVTGVQFHPEKSGPAGLRLLANFVGAS